MSLSIRYCAPLLDHSGYAKGARGYFLSLLNKDVNAIANPIVFDKTPPNLGQSGDIIRSRVNKNALHDINIMHLTPDHYPIFRSQAKLNIGITLWETTQIPKYWVDCINSSVDLLILPCEWNKEVFLSCGVKVPIELLPYGFDPAEFEDTSKLKISGVSDDDFVFFSIFQWTERKNPAGLIKAYMNAFYGVDDVVLLLKTYRSSVDEQEVEAIVDACKILKRDFGAEAAKIPRISLLTSILSDEDIVRLNNRGDCYVSASRSEGWGLGPFNAMAAGKPAISPGGTANEVFMTPENSYLTRYQWTPVFNMPYIRWYDGRQMWLEPDLEHLIAAMQHVYNNRDEAKAKGLLARDHLLANFNHDVVVDQLLAIVEKYLPENRNVAIHSNGYLQR